MGRGEQGKLGFSLLFILLLKVCESPDLVNCFSEMFSVALQ